MLDRTGQALAVDDLLGEITVVIGPPEGETVADRDAVLALIAEERKQGGSPRDVARRVQIRARGWTVKAIYAMMTTGDKP